MVCVLSVWFLSCMQENIMFLIALYSSDHFNKHFRGAIEKKLRNAVSFQNVRGTIITKICSTLLSQGGQT